MPATAHSDTSSRPTVLAAHRRGVTRRCTGLTAMTSMAAISSRILRLPRSAVMADPPAPAISSAAAIGAALAVDRADVERDHHAERDGDEDRRQARDLGDEPALAQVLGPPVLDVP